MNAKSSGEDTAVTEKKKESKGAMTLQNFKEVYLSKFDVFPLGAGLRLHRLEGIFALPVKSIFIPKGNAKSGDRIIPTSISGVKFYIPRGVHLKVPSTVHDLLDQSGYLDGQEMSMHTNDVRESRGQERVGDDRAQD